MFEPNPKPRIFGVPPGADFPRAIAEGVLTRMSDAPPEDLARVRILVNTRRMQRRLRAIFAEHGALLLPRIGLVTELDDLVLGVDILPPLSPLRRRLELANLISALLDADPTLAPRAALFDLAESLAALLDEMQGEDVDPSAVVTLETGDQSGHWARSQAFLSLVTGYLEQSDGQALDAEARRRVIVTALGNIWRDTPPAHPVLVVGSTGSRGTTLALMQAVAALPQGALVLPGFDDLATPAVWNDISDGQGHEDHPQYRFASLLNAVGAAPSDVAHWGGFAPSRRRNELISLSLRPAPVTYQWLTEGPELGDLVSATKDISLIEAPNQRKEAAAIAVAMRLAIESGDTVALVSPDRSLGRRVTATLRRWDIIPDDSAGRPLAQTAPGRLLRQIAHLGSGGVRSEDAIGLLRHPLARTDGSDRGEHLRSTQEFELFLRENGVLWVSVAHLAEFAEPDPKRKPWADWVADVLTTIQRQTEPTVRAQIEAIVTNAEKLASGPDGHSGGALWEKAAGRDTLRVVTDLLEQADAGPEVTREDAARLLDRVLQAENTRNSDDSRPDIMIWGTLEARVQGADVVILGGLNEGVWPARPAHDPWLSRSMRARTGLLLPERQIGLSAHDYQQAFAAKRVILSRSLKDDDAETVTSRWLNRLVNLMSGLPEQNGKDALQAMKDRGNLLLAHADALDQPDEMVEKVARPAPVPPVAVRPRTLSVTALETLIRDPYGIYARYILGLRALNPIRPYPDAAMRGTVFHDILHELIKTSPFSGADELSARLKAEADRALADMVPWPSVRALWLGHLSRIAPKFAEMEMARQAEGAPFALEVWGEWRPDTTHAGIRGKADRIDRLNDGRLAVYDYKSGAPPSLPSILHFKRQLPVEAVMAEAGAFDDVPATEVAFVSHIGLNKDAKADLHKMDITDKRDFRTVTIKAELTRLLMEFTKATKGYPSRRAMEKVRWDGDYDHLARFGEWTDSDPAEAIELP